MVRVERKIVFNFLFCLFLFTCFNLNLNLSAEEQIKEKTFGLVIPEIVKHYWIKREPEKLSYKLNNFISVMDWSNNDSDVKHQGNCGSCWSFAAVALVENIGNKNDLAEQVIVSCVNGDCDGGWYGDALRYIHDHGIPAEECFQYLAAKGNCCDTCEHPQYLEKVQNFDYYGNWGNPTSSTVDDLKNLLQSEPVCVNMLVPEGESFVGYTGGIYNYEGEAISESRAHAVLVVGYNDSEQYFKVKNSWGPDWGEAGYFRIAYDDVIDDVKFGGYACTASGVYTAQLTPVELSFFNANVLLNNVKIEWQTETENNNYGFELARSTDGLNYSKIEFIKGFGTTSIPQTYSYVDNKLNDG